MIGDLVRRKVRPPANPDGGIDGLTPDEEAALVALQKRSDLLNEPGRSCRCGGACTGNVPTDPAGRIVTVEGSR